ncbi:MAG TPA: LPS export ABC transporter periplasmic protein LptC [Candidatus Ozemobacteraceae bacterium]|nr:LPS export ABC transporter periplasmic protein LptC [Candidatus Ozemobacteraceae bacterium]
MKGIFSSVGFWMLMLIIFLVVLMWRDDLEEARTKYVKQKMRLTDVHFSEMDKGFEAVRFFADVVDMDDSQNNMIASRVRALFFDKQVATRSGELLASYAQRTPYEIRFWGDVRLHTTDRERFRAEEARYFQNRRELFTTCPVTIWKDDMIITGKELRYNTSTREGELRRDVLIRIWPAASGSTPASGTVATAADEAPFWNLPPMRLATGAAVMPASMPLASLPVTVPALSPATETTVASSVSTDTASHSSSRINR